MLCTHLYPWQHDLAELEWWDNPFANRPVAEGLVPEVARRQQLVFQGNEGTFATEEPALSIGAVLGIESPAGEAVMDLPE